MNLAYYIIRGRGDDGMKFQLAKVEDEQGNNFKGQYDMARHFGSVDELKTYLASDVLKCSAADLNLTEMNI